MPCVLRLEFPWIPRTDDETVAVRSALLHGRAALAKALVQMGKVQDLAVRFRQVSFDPTAGPAKYRINKPLPMLFSKVAHVAVNRVTFIIIIIIIILSLIHI